MLPLIGATLWLMTMFTAVWADAGEGLTPLPEPVPAPAFTLSGLDGRSHALADYAGRVVIVNFWASWCPPCRAEMPSLNRAWAKLQGKGVAMLAINAAEDRAAVAAFVGDHPIAFPVLLDSDGEAGTRWAVKGLPTTFVIDRAGRIVYRAIGDREWDDPGLLEQILNLTAPPVAPAQAVVADRNR
ncbi:MAG: TlpA disulfide reductase family protein [Candidatus Thiodiazotropha sp.]